MIKKMLAGAALAASVAAIGATAAPQAMAIGNEGGTTTVNGNGAESAYGNTHTGGTESPAIGLVQGSLNKPCVALPTTANTGTLTGAAAPISVQDLNVLTSPQDQQCAESSTQAQGDEPLSHVLSNIPVLTGNGAANR